MDFWVINYCTKHVCLIYLFYIISRMNFHFLFSALPFAGPAGFSFRLTRIAQGDVYLSLANRRVSKDIEDVD